NLFPSFDNPELTIRRRSRSDPTLLNNSEMAAEGNGDLPVPDLRTMKELCQPSLNGRGGPIASIAIQGMNFGLKNDMIQQVQNSCQFHGLPGDDANKHLDKFLHVTQSIKVNEVTNDALRLYLFPHSLTHHATAWFDRLPRNSINTFEQMAKMFLGKYFPHSMFTKLRNEITIFCQRPDESLFEAWERYKLSIDRCPNHNMLPVTQIDTFYNGLTLRHRIPQPQVVTTNEFTNFMKANDAFLKNMQTNMTSLTNLNLELKNMFGQFMKMNTASSSGSRTLPGNTITNPKEDLKGITTRSGTAYQGPTIPTTTSSSLVVERETEATKDMFGPSIKSLLTNKDKLCELARTPLNEHCSTVLLKKLPEILGDLGKFLIPCDFSGMAECLALADLGASINLMPLSMWNKLSLPDLCLMCMTLELAGRSISRPVEVAEDVFVKVGTFHFPVDFVVQAELTSLTWLVKSIRKKFLVFMIDFLLEEVDAFLALEDDPTSPEVVQSYLDFEGDILLLEAFLDDDPSLPNPNQGNYLPQVRKELKICKAKSDKSSIDEPPEVKLKDLPPHLEYTFLKGDDKLPVIIVKDLSVEEKTALITRCMMAIFHDMIEKTMEVFMNDFSVFRNYFQTCLSHLEKMLKRCEDTNLCLNWEKSHFMVKEGIVLGHKISKEGIEVDKAKGDVIAKLPHPTTVKVLRQRQEKHFKPIDYASKTMTEAESNYTTMEKEMLAVVYAFKKFRSYLIMNKSIVYTDHFALKYLFAKKDSKARLLRWVLLLQEFTFKLIDTKGAENVAADHLSRLENPHQNVLDPKEINESFPLEILNLISTR
nr:retrovirus-related Pol polyprotein from transposon 17.6 [Tanacetum cinerariifolium]